jgi:hypothetical protein
VPSASWTLLADTILHRALGQVRGHDSADYGPLIAESREAFTAALDGDSPFAGLVRNADLTVADAEVFAAICAIELDPLRQQAVCEIAGDTAQRRLSLSMVATLFGPDHVGPLALSEDSPLARAALVEIAVARTWSSRLVGPAERVSWHLLGDESLDPGLPLDLDVVEALAGEGDRSEPTDGELVLVVGTDATRRLQAAVGALPNAMFLVVDAPHEPEHWRALVREATISGTGIVLRVEDALSLDARHWIERTPHLHWAITSPAELPLDGLPRRAWRETLAGDPVARPDEVEAVFGNTDADGFGDHRLSAQQLRMIAIAAGGVGGPRAALRRLAAGPIEKLARRIRPRIGWDDLVLPPDQTAQLHELTARYRNRRIVHGQWGASAFPSPGVIALFAGPSGTGKTTAAEVIAADLGVDMFKIEVSSVVSKYIGETEKNLEQLFSAAESGDLVLCFDEADALLGKRSEVSDARDRYANLEVSYLLQRLETYEGMVVMTTNLQSNIDDAFLRRLHARISFPTPGPTERLLIWQRSLMGVPTKDLDLDAVANRFELSGGAIRNAALNGAFMAAAAGTPLTTDLVVLGLKREFQKHGRLITRELFGEWYDLI